ncbi:hypothetical protein [Candidatus Lokiarchaeum ossiferum]|uniref:hypothetical protein n=1 Tax=Candidatus Lokiarchaeum ossiferum TaxID=2951803 RepID=UPI00352C6DD0
MEIGSDSVTVSSVLIKIWEDQLLGRKEIHSEKLLSGVIYADYLMNNTNTFCCFSSLTIFS